eukprot:TRINITY_DN10711_c0_g1_i1.p1 TRINITY_DN10711_c0_g1~~TRINITY_DN10711_c0_g1_i1.p1  ORF type:complete len:119 (-),score=12.54 TRINITY_DN10711_c0_g1_i1:62-418(-)
MFQRARRIVDVFIPMDRMRNEIRGFAFVRFATRKEAESAIDLAKGRSRSWGGRKIQVNTARYGSKEEGQYEVKKPKGIKKGGFRSEMSGGRKKPSPHTQRKRTVHNERGLGRTVEAES